MKLLGASDHPISVLSDDIENELILGTPPKDEIVIPFKEPEREPEPEPPSDSQEASTVNELEDDDLL